jgi:hypothetical protein
MTTLTWPTLTRKLPGQFDWRLVANTQTFQSPLSGAEQTVEMPGARWALAYSMGALDAADAALVRAFFAQLRGRSGRFYMHNLARPLPRGIATGTPVVSGAGQSGTTLVTSGWTPSTAGILKAGDFFGVNGELKLLVADAASNGAGLATLTFEPPLRASPANAAAITTTRPTATFRLDDDVTAFATTAPGLDSFSLAATETW